MDLASIERNNGNFDRAKELLYLVSENHKYEAKYQLSKIELSLGRNINAYNIISSIPKTGDERFNRIVTLEKGIIESSLGNYQYAK